jgi:hypothetical protein
VATVPGERGRDEPKHQVQQRDEPFAVGMEEAVVAAAAEAFGQDVVQQQPQEVGPGQGTGPADPMIVGVAEGHLAVLAAQDVLLWQHPAIEVAPKVHQGLVTRADPLAVDHPCVREPGLDRPALRLHRGEPLGAEDLGQGRMGEEKLALFGAPFLVGAVDRPGWKHDIDVGMKVEGPVVGVKHRGGTEVALQGWITQAEVGKALPTEADQQIVGLALMVEDQGAERRGEGEGDQLIVDRQELGALAGGYWFSMIFG